MLTPEKEFLNSDLKRPGLSSSESSPSSKRQKPVQDVLEGTITATVGVTDRQQKDIERQLEKQKKEKEKKILKLKKEEERKLQKELREAEKRAEKERKEAEKRAEKEKKEAERKAEKERKEAEKAAEKERKEAEKLAEKERKQKEHLKAQPRINLFFKKSAPNGGGASSQQQVAYSCTSSSPGESSKQDESVSDYRKHILPFHVKANAQLFNAVCNYTPKSLDEPHSDPRAWLCSQTSFAERPHLEKKLTSHQFRTQLLLAQESAQVANLLTKLRIRRLQFSHLSPRYAEDPTVPVNEEFRPPYVGSTKDIDCQKYSDLAVDPFRTDVDDSILYDYDSEAEWDHGDGEDLRDDDGEDSDDDVDDPDELKEFLSSDDDDITAATKRSKLVGPLTPIVIWGDSEESAELKQFSVEILRNNLNPFYKGENKMNINEDCTALAVPAAPQDRTVADVLDPLVAKLGYEPLKSTLSTYNGSTGTKTLIVELLKQKFPEATSNEVRSIFDKCMERIGKKRADKKWVLSVDASKYFSLPTELLVFPNAASKLEVGNTPSPSATETQQI